MLLHYFADHNQTEQAITQLPDIIIMKMQEAPLQTLKWLGERLHLWILVYNLWSLFEKEFWKAKVFFALSVNSRKSCSSVVLKNKTFNWEWMQSLQCSSQRSIYSDLVRVKLKHGSLTLHRKYTRWTKCGQGYYF